MKHCKYEINNLMYMCNKVVSDISFIMLAIRIIIMITNFLKDRKYYYKITFFKNAILIIRFIVLK